MVEFWKGEKGMKKTILTIGEPMTIDAQQIAGVFAYKFAKLGFHVTLSNHDKAVMLYVKKHYIFHQIIIQKGHRMTINEIDKCFEEVKRALV